VFPGSTVSDEEEKQVWQLRIQEHRFETTKLLLQYGADPYLESRYKDDALQTACLKGAGEIFEYLVDHVAYTPERVASSFELVTIFTKLFFLFAVTFTPDK
jgi:ankyrin repeat protein